MPDIEIIRRDENAVGKSIPHDIPADIELIPMSSENVLSFGKRTIKRAISPQHISTKITKLNDFNALASSSGEFPKISNTITMSPINVKLLRDSPNLAQQPVETSISIHARNVPNTADTYKTDKNGKLKHTISISTIPQPLTSSVTIMATKPADIIT